MATSVIWPDPADTEVLDELLAEATFATQKSMLVHKQRVSTGLFQRHTKIEWLESSIPPRPISEWSMRTLDEFLDRELGDDWRGIMQTGWQDAKAFASGIVGYA